MKYVLETRVGGVTTIETFEAESADEIIELKDKTERTKKCGLSRP